MANQNFFSGFLQNLKGGKWNGFIRDHLALLKCIAIPLLVGILAALASGGGMDAFAQLKKPPLSPPGWLFPVVWTILYILMGIASYLVFSSDAEQSVKSEALTFYAMQLAANFIWPLLFFQREWYVLSFAWLVFLWVLIYKTIRLFYGIDKNAAYLMLPYLIWVTFAGYLNLGIAVLN